MRGRRRQRSVVPGRWGHRGDPRRAGRRQRQRRRLRPDRGRVLDGRLGGELRPDVAAVRVRPRHLWLRRQLCPRRVAAHEQRLLPRPHRGGGVQLARRPARQRLHGDEHAAGVREDRRRRHRNPREVPPVHAGRLGRPLAGHRALRHLHRQRRGRRACRQGRPLHQLLGRPQRRRRPDAEHLFPARPRRSSESRDRHERVHDPLPRRRRRGRNPGGRRRRDAGCHHEPGGRARRRGDGAHDAGLQRQAGDLHQPGSLRLRGIDRHVHPALPVPEREGPEVHPRSSAATIRSRSSVSPRPSPTTRR